MKAAAFDKKFDDDEQDIIEDLNLLMMKCPGRDQPHLEGDGLGESTEPLKRTENIEDPKQ